ncbi:unnamed protein product [Caretta caretta]
MGETIGVPKTVSCRVQTEIVGKEDPPRIMAKEQGETGDEPAVVPIPIGLVEPTEIDQPVGPVTRRRARELASVEMASEAANAEEQPGELKEEVDSEVMGASMPAEKGSPLAIVLEKELSEPDTVILEKQVDVAEGEREGDSQEKTELLAEQDKCLWRFKLPGKWSVLYQKWFKYLMRVIQSSPWYVLISLRMPVELPSVPFTGIRNVTVHSIGVIQNTTLTIYFSGSTQGKYLLVLMKEVLARVLHRTLLILRVLDHHHLISRRTSQWCRCSSAANPGDPPPDIRKLWTCLNELVLGDQHPNPLNQPVASVDSALPPNYSHSGSAIPEELEVEEPEG